MAKTFSASDIADHWRDIVDEANANGEAVVKNEGSDDVVVVPIARWAKVQGKSMHEVMEKLRKEWDEQLAVLKEPGTSEKLLEIFSLSPEEIAAAANADAPPRKR